MARGTDEKRTYISFIKGDVVERLAKSNERMADLNREEIARDYPDCNRIREYVKDGAFQNTFIERIDSYIEGLITGVTVRSGDYGDQLIVTIDDGVEEFHVQMGVDTSNARCFLQILPNIESISPVKIRPWKGNNGGEGLNISQGGNKLSFFWTKENPGKHPQPPNFGDIQYENWNRTQKTEYKSYQMDRLNFLLDNMEELAKNFSKPEGPPASDTAPSPEKPSPVEQKRKEATDTSLGDMPDDDLPF